MPSTSAAVASSPVALHFAMLPAPTNVTGPGEVENAGVGARIASVGPRSSRQVAATTTAMTDRAARTAERGTVRSGALLEASRGGHHEGPEKHEACRGGRREPV